MPRNSIVFWHSLFLLSLILFISLVAFYRNWNKLLAETEPQHNYYFSSGEFPHLLNTSLKGISLAIGWRIDWPSELLEFRVLFSPARSVSLLLIGFSDHGQLENSDFCLFNVFSGQMEDGWLDRRLALRRDVHQDCQLTKASAGGEFWFKRKWSTCDPRDYRIEMGTSNLILAIGRNGAHVANSGRLPDSLKDPRMASQMRFIQLLPPNATIQRPVDHGKNTRQMEIRASQVPIPARVTTYWCAIVELAQWLRSRKHHAVKFEAVISPGSEQFVHHFEIFHCQRPTKVFAGDCSEDKPPEARGCSRVLAAWAMGANPVVYPPEAGMPIGGPGFVPFLMVEIHYNNPDRVAGIRDSSGLRITLTERLRPFDAGILELGLIYSDANSIPPGQSAWPMTGFCPEDCTRKFPAHGIHIFASQLHAHLTGRKLVTSLVRDGRKIGELNRDNHYSPHWQHIQPLWPHVHVRPGDVLATTCVYETRTLDRWTWGGYGIEDEMCVNYVHYYPATEVEVCKSAISNSSLHAFFTKMGIKNSKRRQISKNYSAIRWSPAKVDLLRELYHVSPLNVHCLQHSGIPFPGHASEWERVPRPEFTSSRTDWERGGNGPAGGGGGDEGGECLAIND